MFLKRLDIIGFKSFPDRVRLEFLPGLTAVVGPNGSGKSNIADAVRWVMGEQSAKSLRGGKMEDVIFSGTEHRRPLGYAEVVMTVDNAGGALPLAFPEVSVARRLYRSGESEFLINNAPCRLKDIQLLFMDTGVGREGYSIIGQGRIDEILSARSEDRRLLFEEAAGIAKYRTRRGEALHKLERERQNLTRVNDIVEELENQITPLAEQAERAKTWMALREEYKTARINIFLEDARRLQADAEKTEALLADLAAQSESGRMLLTEARTAGDTLKTTAASADTRLRLAHEKRLEIATEIEKKESAVRLLETERENARNNRTRLEAEAVKRGEALALNRAETEAAGAAALEAEQTLDALRNQLLEGQSAFRELDETMRAREQALDQYNRDVMEQIAVSADLKADLREAENTYARLETEKARIDEDLALSETRLAEAVKNHAAVEDALAENGRGLAKQQKLTTAYAEARSALGAETEALTARERETQAGLHSCVTRHKALSDMEQHHEGYYRSVRAVLRRKREDPAYAGICGAVGELIAVPEAYETAVEIALGGAAQNLVAQTEEDAKRAIEMLKETREGRATFLPLNAVEGRKVDAARLGLDREPGYIGLAVDLIEYDAAYAPAVSHLLGNVLVVDGLDNALRLHKKHRYRQKLVTLEGELLSPGGAMTGGGAAKAGLIGRGRQIKELSERIKTLRAEAQALSQALEGQKEKLSATDALLAAAREAISQLRLDENNLQNQRAQAETKTRAERDAADACAAENGRVMSQLVETNARVREIKKEILRQEAAVEETRRQMDDYQRRILNERGHRDEQTGALTELRVEIGRRTEGLNAARQAAARLAREKDRLAAEAEALEKEIALTDRADLQKQEAARLGMETLAQLKQRLEEERDALTAIETEKTELDTAIGRAEADERARMDEAARLDKETARLEMRREQLNTDSRRLYDEMWDEYGLTYQTALPFKRADLNDAFLRREERRLRTLLAEYADVNVGAVEAHKQLKIRYDFLTAQRDDIRRAEDDLRAVIDTLTRQMEARFTEQFVQISKHFNDVFREMFGGGQAAVALLDDKHILESGIEITAQPPGKSLQTLQLLSGGEKALTAIALLFGILRMKPSPFCVLDEIEAALDDANVARFAEFLKQFAGETQMIVITHRQGTMEAADTLYGVTMQEKGISKMVSVRFMDSNEPDAV